MTVGSLSLFAESEHDSGTDAPLFGANEFGTQFGLLSREKIELMVLSRRARFGLRRTAGAGDAARRRRKERGDECRAEHSARRSEGAHCQAGRGRVICADTAFHSPSDFAYTSTYRLSPGVPLFAVHDPVARTSATSP